MWNNLEKGKKLFLIIPFIDNDNNIEYHYQESHIISCHEYQNLFNIRFKYTNQSNKRIRVNLYINRLKFSQNIVAVNDYTRYARGYSGKYGDILLTYISKDLLFEEFENIKKEKYCQIQEEIIEKNNLASNIINSRIVF